ncbi:MULTISPECIES: DUF4191 domain-containing protein [Aestuariimicrobium]|uniref:DUF4191 domain-containing protein n=1 Tax=Aestuariimicrobium TaxID=396388 RepID=UPI0003B485EF|nr:MULTISPECIES: DUF4191 domain-containing protein [Aestuariimicrobium]CAI9399840.1 hypothetical protein AESSP_00273 [Aestuariimicrobium sp. T2.26MG-19.2B]
MASEAAKELARKQKEQARAEKERRKHSDNPRDWGTVRQLTETYKRTQEYDKALPWMLLGAFLVALVVFLVVGLIVQPWWMWLLLGISFGLVAAMLVLLWRVRKATYARFDGQAGSGEVALSMLDKKKWTTTPAITGTRQLDVIHRALGPSGLFLIAEGDPNRLKSLLSTEVRRHEQATNGVKVITIQMGSKPGQVPLNKLADHLKKQPKTLDAARLADLQSRLRALDTMRNKLPIPKGPLPTRGSRSSLRGR